MPQSPHSTTAILDNGGGLLKLAMFPAETEHEKATLTVPNALAKPASNAIPAPASVPGKSRRPPGLLVAGEIANAPDVSAMVFRRPHDRGIISAFDVQRDIWASAFSSDRGIDLSMNTSPSLLLTEPLGVPMRVRQATDQLVFEVFTFSSYAFSSPQRLAAVTTINPYTSMQLPTCLVLDSGFSATTAVPIVNGQEVPTATRRLSLGGKALTNLLKQTVSFRSWNMADETAVINSVKERCCYVAPDYRSALNAIRHTQALSYVLPDPARYSDRLGHIRQGSEEQDPSDQVLYLKNERISVPETLFNPADIGLNQAGVAELIVQAVQACEPHHHADLFSNVLLTGGNCLFPGFRNRLVADLRPLINSDVDLVAHLDADPIHTALRGGMAALQHGSIPLNFITREKYLEVGSDALIREIYGD